MQITDLKPAANAITEDAENALSVAVVVRRMFELSTNFITAVGRCMK
jgi:hypothetical protein